jgi:hypothetical protein
LRIWKKNTPLVPNSRELYKHAKATQKYVVIWVCDHVFQRIWYTFLGICRCLWQVLKCDWKKGSHNIIFITFSIFVGPTSDLCSRLKLYTRIFANQKYCWTLLAYLTHNLMAEQWKYNCVVSFFYFQLRRIISYKLFFSGK